MAETARMILCDTNILIEFYKNNLQVVEELRRIGKERLAVSAVTQAELYFGAINKAELKKIRRHLAASYHIGYSYFDLVSPAHGNVFPEP